MNATDTEAPAEADLRPADPGDDLVTEVGAGPSATIRKVSIGIGILVFGLVLLLAFGRGEGGERDSAVLGQRVPQVKGMPIQGLAGYSVNTAGEPREFNIDSYAGDWILVNFFSSWCAPCLAEHPDLVELEEWGADNNFRVAAVIFSDPDTSGIEEFFNEQGGNWPVLRDASTSIDFQISQVPESFLVAPSGLVVEHYVGGIGAEDVQATIAQFTETDLPSEVEQ